MIIGCIMPTYNQVEFIEEAYLSVIDQVDRLVIVNDGSTDGTEQWLDENHDYVVHSNKNQGTAEAINLGKQFLAGFDWLTWVSSDNVMRNDWISSLKEIISPATGAVYGGFDWVKGGYSRYHFTKYDPRRLISQEDCYFGPAFLIREDVWQNHRGKISHDYDNWLRVEEACWDKGLCITGVNNSLCYYRAHPKRVTVLKKDQYDAPHWRREAIKRRKL